MLRKFQLSIIQNLCCGYSNNLLEPCFKPWNKLVVFLIAIYILLFQTNKYSQLYFQLVDHSISFVEFICLNLISLVY